MNQKPDKLESSIRLGCGGLLGIPIGIYIAIEFRNSIGFILPMSISAIVLAFLSYYYGDKFWDFVVKHFKNIC